MVNRATVRNAGVGFVEELCDFAELLAACAKLRDREPIARATLLTKGIGLEEAKGAHEREMIRLALLVSKSQAAAARALKISPRTLYSKIKQHRLG